MTLESVKQGIQRSGTVSSVAHSVQNVATELLHKDPPPGFFAATAEAASHAPTIGEIRRGSYAGDGWHAPEQVQQRMRTMSQESDTRRSRRLSASSRERSAEAKDEHSELEMYPTLTEEPSRVSRFDQAHRHKSTPGLGVSEEEERSRATIFDDTKDSITTSERTDHGRIPQPITKDRRVYSSGYIPPPAIPWTTSSWIGLKAFGKWFCTPFGFLLTIYGLNVVAWGGMLFLLLCNASRPMCWAPIHVPGTEGHRSPAASLALGKKYPTYFNCNDINSPRRIWLEIDSQILNSLFCVTGFGLIPWRFRDLYYLLRWRLTSEKRHGRERKLYGMRVLAGIYRNWFRLPDSHTLDQMTTAEYQRQLTKTDTSATSAFPPINTADVESGGDDLRFPLPLSKSPDDPLTDVRAPPTAPWKLDFFVWSQAFNTFFQCCLCGFMWGMNRYDRPSWVTGLFIALGCIIAGAGGYVSFLEGKKVKRVEGVAAGVVREEDGDTLERTRTGRESVVVGEKGKGGVSHV